MKLLKKPRFMYIFIVPFMVLSFYVIFIQTELFQSSSTLMVKDLQSTPTSTDLMSALIPSSSSNMQDSMILEKYIQSEEMFRKVDRVFNLKEHYMSDKIDAVNRCYGFSTMEDFLKVYRSRLIIRYDEISGTLDINFLHADAITAQQILFFIVKESTQTLNQYDKENGAILLNFIQQQEQENRKLLTDAIEKLVAYQNKNRMIDPSIDIKSKSSILAQLEAKLVQKETEYSTLKQYMNDKSPELKILRGEIQSIKHKLSEIKTQLAGSNENELNENLFEFEELKAEVEYKKERYKQTLIQLDLAKIQATQNSKNLIIVTQPTLPDYYSYPNKIKTVITILLVLLLLYGIITMVQSIVKDHRD